MSASQISCPHCKKAFKIDETGYAEIVKQVRDDEFKSQMQEHRKLAERDKQSAVKLARTEAAGEAQKDAANKASEIEALKAKLDAEDINRKLAVTKAVSLAEKARDALASELSLAKQGTQSAVELAQTKAVSEVQSNLAAKGAEIRELKLKLEAEEASRKLAVAEAVDVIEKERNSLVSDLKLAKQEARTASNLADAKLANELQKTVTSKDTEIQGLRAKLDATTAEQKFAVSEAIGEVEKDRRKLQGELEKAELEKQLSEQCLKDRYETQIKDRDGEIRRLGEMKARLSTKMLGETLEQHCEIEFNRIRAAAFPRAYFEKDNDVRMGSKGDYIFRDENEVGTEIVSIMFEMKNENDRTATKHRNEEFFRQLDKDRTEKKCEYAVLVSLLEPESELYNSGIVDVSHRYPKMYVVRPQLFIPIITLLRNAATSALHYKTELALVRAQNVDISNFESQLLQFQTAFARNYDLASRHFETAINGIDKSIDHLQKTKAALLSTDNNLRLANDKAQDVTIRKLTRGNPTMAKKFSDLSIAAASNAG